MPPDQPAARLTPEDVWEEITCRVQSIRTLIEEELKTDDFDDRIGIRHRRDDEERRLGHWIVRYADDLAESVRAIAERGIA